MKCREFERYVADLAAGRLPAALANRLESHAAVCEQCAAQKAAELRLRGVWRSLPDVAPPGDMWRRVSNRLAESPQPTRRPLLAPRSGWVWGGACAGVLALLVLLRLQPIGPPAAHQELADEQRVIRLVADHSEIPNPDSDPYLVDLRASRDATRSALVGALDR